MIGMWADRSRRLMISAVSSPSMPGICTSRRMTAKSPWSSRQRSASLPELALTSSWPNGSSNASRASRLAGWSSTMRILARSSSVTSGLRFHGQLEPDRFSGAFPGGVDHRVAAPQHRQRVHHGQAPPAGGVQPGVAADQAAGVGVDDLDAQEVAANGHADLQLGFGMEHGGGDQLAG